MGVFTYYTIFCLFTFSYLVKHYFFDMSNLDQHIRMGLDMEEEISEFSDKQYKIAVMIGYITIFIASPLILINLRDD
jgi:hypothetical protein